MPERIRNFTRPRFCVDAKYVIRFVHGISKIASYRYNRKFWSRHGGGCNSVFGVFFISILHRHAAFELTRRAADKVGEVEGGVTDLKLYISIAILEVLD